MISCHTDTDNSGVNSRTGTRTCTGMPHENFPVRSQREPENPEIWLSQTVRKLFGNSFTELWILSVGTGRRKFPFHFHVSAELFSWLGPVLFEGDRSVFDGDVSAIGHFRVTMCLSL